MHQTTQLQFRLMAPEAQHAAVQRLALRGADIETICERTGLSATEVRRYLAGSLLPRAGTPPASPVYAHWMRQPGSTPWTHRVLKTGDSIST